VVRFVERVIRILLAATGTYLTHDSGYELPNDEWDVRSHAEEQRRAFYEKLARQTARDQRPAQPSHCPKCGNTLDHRGAIVVCFTTGCEYTRAK
jgi:hypothetical protein